MHRVFYRPRFPATTPTRFQSTREAGHRRTAFGLGLNLDTFRDAAIDPEAVFVFVIPFERPHFAGAKAEHQHSYDESVAIAQIKQNERDLLGRKMLGRLPLD